MNSSSRYYLVAAEVLPEIFVKVAEAKVTKDEKNGKVLRPERIKIFKYSPEAESNSNENN